MLLGALFFLSASLSVCEFQIVTSGIESCRQQRGHGGAEAGEPQPDRGHGQDGRAGRQPIKLAASLTSHKRAAVFNQAVMSCQIANH